MTTTDKKELLSVLRDFVRRTIDQAIEDAKLFVEEFGEPLDASQTDWDSVAWGEFAREQQLPNDLCDALWPVYSWALIEETERLAAL